MSHTVKPTTLRLPYAYPTLSMASVEPGLLSPAAGGSNTALDAVSVISAADDDDSLPTLSSQQCTPDSPAVSVTPPPPSPSPLVHPWPRWSSVFEYVGVVLQSEASATKHAVLAFVCLLCKENGARQGPLKAPRSSRSNLKRHMESKHRTDPAWLAVKALPPPSLSSQTSQTGAAGVRSNFVSPSPPPNGVRSNFVSPSPPPKRMKQTKIGDSFTRRRVMTQAHYDDALEELVIMEMLPFHCVERGNYLKYFRSTSPDFTVMTRKTLMARIKRKYAVMKSSVIACLGEAVTVGTTCDLWSCHGRSFIGVTAHWIEKNDLERKSAVLACRRVTGRHTYDVVGTLLSGIHKEFKIEEKVCMTTTDNGSNMVKAFAFYKEVSRNTGAGRHRDRSRRRCEADVFVVEEEEEVSDASDDDDDGGDGDRVAGNVTGILLRSSEASGDDNGVSLCNVVLSALPGRVAHVPFGPYFSLFCMHVSSVSRFYYQYY